MCLIRILYLLFSQFANIFLLFWIQHWIQIYHKNFVLASLPPAHRHIAIGLLCAKYWNNTIIVNDISNLAKLMSLTVICNSNYSDAWITISAPFFVVKVSFRPIFHGSIGRSMSDSRFVYAEHIRVSEWAAKMLKTVTLCLHIAPFEKDFYDLSRWCNQNVRSTLNNGNTNVSLHCSRSLCSCV